MCRAPPGTTREHAGTGARAVPQVRAAGPPAAARLLWPQRGSAPPPPCRVLSSLPRGVDEDPAGMTHCACGLHSLMRPVRNVRGSLFAETWTPEQQLSDATRPGCPEGRAGACLSSWTWGAGISISRASPSPCAVGREGGGRGFPGGREPDSEFALGARFSADLKSQQSGRAGRCCSLLCRQSSSPTLGLAGQSDPLPGSSPRRTRPAVPGAQSSRLLCLTPSLPRLPRELRAVWQRKEGGSFHRPLRGGFPLFSFPGTKKILFSTKTHGASQKQHRLSLGRFYPVRFFS